MLEIETAALASNHLKHLGFDKVFDRLGGHGLVGVLKNGHGPTVMLRADMDALPVEELTKLPYASSKRMVDRYDRETPLMHACGHDVHVSCLMGAAELLHSARSTWSGTLICLFQPGEEDGAGARKMVEDGLFNKIPKPDVLLGQHVARPYSACDCFDVRLFGRGGHGSAPHRCIDPVLAACSTVVRLQGIVSREVDPAEYAVVTCVYLRTATAINIIPDVVDMKIDVRTYNSDVRKKVVQAVKRVIHGESDAFGLPKEPEIVQTDDIPPIINDSEVVKTLQGAFGSHFVGLVSEMVRDTGSDDFSIFAEAQSIPSAYWNIGGVDPAIWDDAERSGTIGDLPGNHSAYFAPVVEPTIRTGIDAMALAALAFLKIRT
ncbi:putative hippurate hydrolase [Mollisia scopiformis]|uniref:Putative hippurate hydrolase n=1 Tax=Mollisia scopiformis TaxID=149040 RepID=A0A132B321_MOLSC|nr:putative hippurate hydrolase [Mollisia scopiformis]KUJ06731.1 putative hippurate hydrolase [Mollisia scopiformis]